jgi:hypothetical protein
MKRKHEWLRQVLMDTGHTQKDLAKAWDVTDAVVSRFLATGDPEPGVERLRILGRMIGMEMNELLVRLSEGLAPPPRPSPVANAPGKPKPRTSLAVDDAIAELKAAAERARAAGYEVSIHIKREEDL